jgi:hypothetical protein
MTFSIHRKLYNAMTLMNPEATQVAWKPLYKLGGIAALLATILFRRNIGAEVSLFTGADAIPHSAVEWFRLLQSNPFVGMSFLAVFDLINYALVGLVFLALATMFWQTHKSIVMIALASGLVGITISFATNISISMMSLSQQYAAASTEAERAALLNAGQSLMAFNSPMTNFPETGTYLAYLLIALAEISFASLLLRFHRVAGIVGLLAGGCDLMYCLIFAIAPILQVILMSCGGLFWMIWHILIGMKLLKLAKELT